MSTPEFSDDHNLARRVFDGLPASAEEITEFQSEIDQFIDKDPRSIVQYVHRQQVGQYEVELTSTHTPFITDAGITLLPPFPDADIASDYDNGALPPEQVLLQVSITNEAGPDLIMRAMDSGEVYFDYKKPGQELSIVLEEDELQISGRIEMKVSEIRALRDALQSLAWGQVRPTEFVIDDIMESASDGNNIPPLDIETLEEQQKLISECMALSQILGEPTLITSRNVFDDGKLKASRTHTVNKSHGLTIGPITEYNLRSVQVLQVEHGMAVSRYIHSRLKDGKSSLLVVQGNQDEISERAYSSLVDYSRHIAGLLRFAENARTKAILGKKNRRIETLMMILIEQMEIPDHAPGRYTHQKQIPEGVPSNQIQALIELLHDK